jgi:hypothetical protein
VVAFDRQGGHQLEVRASDGPSFYMTCEYPCATTTVASNSGTDGDHPVIVDVEATRVVGEMMLDELHGKLEHVKAD